MDIHEALMTRRTAHMWCDEPVPFEVIERALEAAQMAPCHRLTWPWRFALAGPDTRKCLHALGLRLKSPKDGSEPGPALLTKIEKKLKNPAHLLIVSQPHHDDPFIHHENYAAISAAIQNFCLSVHGDGFATKWSTGSLTTHPETYALADINPDAESIVGFVWVGVPVRVSAPPPRPPMEEVFRILK